MCKLFKHRVNVFLSRVGFSMASPPDDDVPDPPQPYCRAAVRSALWDQTSDLFMIDFVQKHAKPVQPEPGGLSGSPPMLQPAWLFEEARETLVECKLVKEARVLIDIPAQNNDPDMPRYAVHLAFLMYHARHCPDVEGISLTTDLSPKAVNTPLLDWPIGGRLRRSVQSSSKNPAEIGTFIHEMRKETEASMPTFLFNSVYGEDNQWEYVVEVAMKILLTQNENKVSAPNSTVDSIVDAAYDAVLYDFTQDVSDKEDNKSAEMWNAIKEFVRIATQKAIPNVYYNGASGAERASSFRVQPSHVNKATFTDPLKRWYRSFVYQRYYGRYMTKVFDDKRDQHEATWERRVPSTDEDRVELREHINTTTDGTMDVTAWVDEMPAVLRQWAGIKGIEALEMMAVCREDTEEDVTITSLLAKMKKFGLTNEEDPDEKHSARDGTDDICYKPALFSQEKGRATNLDVPHARDLVRRVGKMFSVVVDDRAPTKHREKGLHHLHPTHREKLAYLDFCLLRRRSFLPVGPMETFGPTTSPCAPTMKRGESIDAGRQTEVETWIAEMAARTREFNTCFRKYMSRHDMGPSGECVQADVSRVESQLQRLIFTHIGVDMGCGDQCPVPPSVNAVLLNMLEPSTCLQAAGALVQILCDSYSTALHAGPGGAVWFVASWEKKLDFLLYLLLQHLHAGSVGRGPDGTENHDLTADSLCLTQPRSAKDLLKLHTDRTHGTSPHTSYEDLVEALSEKDSNCRRLLFPHRCLRWLRVLGSDTTGHPTHTYTLGASLTTYTLTECLLELRNIRLHDTAKVYTWPTILKPRIKHEKHLVEHIVCVVLVLAGVDLLPTGITFSGIYPPDPVAAESALAEEEEGSTSTETFEDTESALAEEDGGSTSTETFEDTESALAEEEGGSASTETEEDAGKLPPISDAEKLNIFRMISQFVKHLASSKTGSVAVAVTDADAVAPPTSKLRDGGAGGMVFAGCELFDRLHVALHDTFRDGTLKIPDHFISVQRISRLFRDPRRGITTVAAAPVEDGEIDTISSHNRRGAVLRTVASFDSKNNLARLALAGAAFAAYMGSPKLSGRPSLHKDPQPQPQAQAQAQTPTMLWFPSNEVHSVQTTVQDELFHFTIMVMALCGEYVDDYTGNQQQPLCFSEELHKSFQALTFNVMDADLVLVDNNKAGTVQEQRILHSNCRAHADGKDAIERQFQCLYDVQENKPDLRLLMNKLFSFNDTPPHVRQEFDAVDDTMKHSNRQIRYRLEQVLNYAQLYRGSLNTQLVNLMRTEPRDEPAEISPEEPTPLYATVFRFMIHAVSAPSLEFARIIDGTGESPGIHCTHTNTPTPLPPHRPAVHIH